MITIQAIVIWSLVCGITFYMAPKRGRDPWKWLVFAMLFGIFALLALLILPAEEKNSEEEKSNPSENDTSVVVTAAPDIGEQDPVWKLWFYIDTDKKQQGPVNFEQLKSLWSEKKIDKDSFIWTDGMQQWKRISELEELDNELKK